MSHETKSDQQVKHVNITTIAYETAASDIRNQILTQFKYHDLTLKDVAQQSDVDETRLRDVCYGSAPLSYQDATAVMRVFGIELRFAVPWTQLVVKQPLIGIRDEYLDGQSDAMTSEIRAKL